MKNEISEESESLLRSDRSVKTQCKWRRKIIIHATFTALQLCCTILGLLLVRERYIQSSLNTLNLTGERLPLTRQKFVLSVDSPYAGPPSPKIDEAWTQLLEHVNIRASKSELASSNQTSVPLTGESGFLVWMEVSHQLHCVKYLRQWTYRQHYHPEVGPHEEARWLLHTDHCLDLIRQALMCRADTSLMTFKWANISEKPMLKLESPQHTCIDWTQLIEKVRSRRISDADMALLVNPDMS